MRLTRSNTITAIASANSGLYRFGCLGHSSSANGRSIFTGSRLLRPVADADGLVEDGSRRAIEVVDGQLAAVLPEVHASVKLGAVVRVPEEAHLGAGLTQANGHQGGKVWQDHRGLEHHLCPEIILNPILPNIKIYKFFFSAKYFLTAKDVGVVSLQLRTELFQISGFSWFFSLRSFVRCSFQNALPD